MKIVRKIDFVERELDGSWSSPASSYGSLHKIIGTFKVEDLSINQSTNQSLKAPL